MSSYDKLIERLYALAPPLVKPGLRREHLLLKSLNNPQYAYPSVHVAGTNGKGSTCAFLHSILKESSLKAALYTSPHLIKFNERIKVGSRYIGNAEVSSLALNIVEKTKKLGIRPTFFEFTTAMAFEYFRRKGADIAVIETGMGGRLDATNVLRPRVCVITSVGLEHTRELGATIKAIAKEKCGIIKRGACVITAVEDKNALKVIRAEAKRKNARLYEYGKDFFMRSGKGGITYNGTKEYEGLELSLPGDYQLRNAACAIMAADLLSFEHLAIDEGAIRRGLKSAEWPGRMQFFDGSPGVLVDAAHNPEGARALASELIKMKKSKIVFVAAIMKDKDVAKILKELSRASSRFVLTSVENERSADEKTITLSAKKAGLDFVFVPRVKDAIDAGARIAGKNGLVCVTGSIFTAAEAIAGLGSRRRVKL